MQLEGFGRSWREDSYTCLCYLEKRFLRKGFKNSHVDEKVERLHKLKNNLRRVVTIHNIFKNKKNLA